MEIYFMESEQGNNNNSGVVNEKKRLTLGLNKSINIDINKVGMLPKRAGSFTVSRDSKGDFSSSASDNEQERERIRRVLALKRAKEQKAKQELAQQKAKQFVNKEETTAAGAGDTQGDIQDDKKNVDSESTLAREKHVAVKPAGNKKQFDDKKTDPASKKKAVVNKRNISFEEEVSRKGKSPTKKKKTEDKYDIRKLKQVSVSSVDDFDERITVKSLSSEKRRREKIKRQNSAFVAPTNQQIVDKKKATEIVIHDQITVKELANKMSVRSAELMRELNKLGISGLDKSHPLDSDIAEIIVYEMGYKSKLSHESSVEDVLLQDINELDLVARAPVITIMGHVDHGKTSLLDYFRNSDIVRGEAGGITQHIGAYKVQLAKDFYATFLDTPGHEAFTAMRMRGAKVTDIAIIVIAADDGIMDQTIESIHHAKAAGVQIMIVINKIDKPDADPQGIVNALLSHEVVSEKLGGDVIIDYVSVKNKTGLDSLKKNIMLQAEYLELKASEKVDASGVVIESHLDKKVGVITNLLIQQGSIKIGDFIIAGNAIGKIRRIRNDRGNVIKEAGISMPVEVIGLDKAPMSGEKFHYVKNEKIGKNIVSYRMKVAKAKEEEKQSLQLQNSFLFNLSAKGKQKEFKVIVKADVSGSTEAIVDNLKNLPSDEVKVKIIHSGVGGITDNDVTLSKSSDAMILGFNVRANESTTNLAEKEGVKIMYYSVIYKLIGDVKDIMSGMLPPKIQEHHIGKAVIREVYNVSKVGKVAGCLVTEGLIKRGCGVRLLRNNTVIHNSGKLKTLKRFDNDVDSVRKNYECGMAFENYNDIQKEDVIEFFEVKEVKRSL